MIAREFFFKISTIFGMISDALAKRVGRRENAPFGGINTIIVGDHHQFPPIAGTPLYWPCNSARDSDGEILGRKLYEQFTTVVILREQMRVVDAEWLAFLQAAWRGECQPHHIKMLRGLVLTNPSCPKTDFSSEEWSKAVLVTPQHTVCMQWNDQAIRMHCRRTKQTLFKCRTKDLIKGRELMLEERFAVVMKQDKRWKGCKERAGLPTVVEFAKGMEVMVTYNVKMDLNVANGARGWIHDLVLHENETSSSGTAKEVELKNLPVYLLIKFDRTWAHQLEGLPQGILPLEPISKSFQITMSNGEKKTVKRTQIPLTAAYAFTDYRSQGQILCHVIVDIGKPPGAHGLTPFHIYVALSRSSGRDTIRLLRDSFDESLFVNGGCAILRAEDDRLEVLDARSFPAVAYATCLPRFAWLERMEHVAPATASTSC